MTPEAVQCPSAILAHRTKMFHVKHFGAIGGLHNLAVGARDMIQGRDLVRPKECETGYVFASGFFSEPSAKHAIRVAAVRFCEAGALG
jgi:hypothetical protein